MEIISSVLHSLGFDPVVFGSQIVLFYLMHLLLKPILYRPLEEARNQRDALTFGRVDQAGRINREALDLKAAYEGEIRQIRQATQATVQQARARRQQARVARLAAARAEAETLVQVARKEILAERIQAEVELDREVQALSLAVASRLVETMTGEPQRGRVLDRLREAI